MKYLFYIIRDVSLSLSVHARNERQDVYVNQGVVNLKQNSSQRISVAASPPFFSNSSLHVQAFYKKTFSYNSV